jgi:hypothetical protein
MLARGSVVRTQDPDSHPTPFGVKTKTVRTTSPGKILPLYFVQDTEEFEECSDRKFSDFDIFEINSATSDNSGGLEFSSDLTSFQSYSNATEPVFLNVTHSCVIPAKSVQ